MEVKRCSACRGTKRQLGMGGMERKCQECKGIGYIEDKDAAPAPVKLEALTNVSGAPVVAKRKGRPPRKVEAQAHV